ncbi:hypothetical protein GYMLUDRAFT_225099 [Collybiopsis luxurians FD-317 M1]|uniref:P/Homo B domain-containing protein n=1 Tax=Collybiopsis luxurians FD-317 M1 TaxID=944289 RepID=A0A0D0BCJ0_9AGAR|nr:hypothetical protein GYMLUDRAFT_225099 [Collybiopsis luxurians FD-317 M1]
MLLSTFVVLLSIAGSVSATARRSYDTHNYYVLELDTQPEYYASLLGVEIVEQVGELEGFWLVRGEKNLTKREEGGEDAILARFHATKPSPMKSLIPQIPRKRVKRALPTTSDVAAKLGIQDPLFPDQWHLINPDAPEHMMNVSGLWEEGYTGVGVTSSLIDDGLDYTSEDLAENFDAANSYDYNDHESLPTPKLADDTHGTRCAGQIAAVKNGVCGLGIAYHSRVAAVRILSGAITDADEAAALNQGYDEVSIYSCSWGPTDDGRTMDGPDYIITKSIVNGINRGRQGKGSVFVFASGNGKGSGDECNYDGYTNSIWSVTVGAVDSHGRSPWYSEACAANMVVAYSSGGDKSIVTTDKGKNKCTKSHGGTSAAAPNAVGVYALALQARPDLTWRDIQHLTVRTARPLNYDPSNTSPASADTDYELTFAKRPFSYAFGYGALDGYAFVHAALDWKLVARQTWMKTRTVVLGDGKMTKEKEFSGGIPFGGAGEGSVSSTLEVTEKMMRRARFDGLEHINVRVWIEHGRRGDVYVEVVSPNGIKSVLAGVSSKDGGGRKSDKDKNGFPGWLFMSVKHWDENPLGIWTITVSDPVNSETTGKFLGWNMIFWGSSTDTSVSAADDEHKYELPPDDENVFPPVEAEEDEEDIPLSPTTTLATTTTTEERPTGSTSRMYTKPTHFLSTGVVDGVETTSTSSSTAASSSDSSPSDSTLSKIFSSQKPIYALLEFLFLVAVAIALFVFFMRRRRQKREDYEALTRVGDNVAMGRIRREGERRGEMYDAFDEGSDEDEYEDARDDQPMLPRSAREGASLPASAGGGGGQSAQQRYRDEPLESESPSRAEQGDRGSHLRDERTDDSGSSGSWEHT